MRTCVGKARVHAADDVCAVGGQTSGYCVCQFRLQKCRQKSCGIYNVYLRKNDSVKVLDAARKMKMFLR